MVPLFPGVSNCCPKGGASQQSIGNAGAGPDTHTPIAATVLRHPLGSPRPDLPVQAAYKHPTCSDQPTENFSSAWQNDVS